MKAGVSGFQAFKGWALVITARLPRQSPSNHPEQLSRDFFYISIDCGKEVVMTISDIAKAIWYIALLVVAMLLVSILLCLSPILAICFGVAWCILKAFNPEKNVLRVYFGA